MKLSFPLSFLLLSGALARADVRVVPQSRNAAQLKAQSGDIEAQIDGAAQIAEVKETWIFANASATNFEAELVCEAPKNALMTGFAYWYRGERVVARVVERERAVNIYNLFNPVDVPMARRRDPALVEMLARNFLKVRIGPVDAKKPLQIELFYSQPLETAAGRSQLPLHLRDASPLTLEKFALRWRGVGEARLSLDENAATGAATNAASFQKEAFAVPQTATLDFAAPKTGALLQSAARNGYFAGVLSEAQWQTRASWRGASEIVSKVLDADRILVCGRFERESPAKLLGLTTKIDAVNARLWWTALQIEALESSPQNYARVVALSKQSGLPSALTSWLAIPSSERKTLEAMLHPPDTWKLRQEMGQLGNALAIWKALGKTRTPQYRAMLAQFNARRAKSSDYYVKQTLQERETNYANTLREMLRQYAQTTPDLGGAKVPVFALQLQRLGAENSRNDVRNAREILRTRRLVARLSAAAASGRPLLLSTLPPGGREQFLRELATRSVQARAKNPTFARRLHATLQGAAARWGMQRELRSRIYDAEYALYGQQIFAARSALESSIFQKQENTPQGQKLARQFDALIARTEFLGHDGLALSESIAKLYLDAQIERRREPSDAAKISRLDAERERLSALSRMTPAFLQSQNQYRYQSSAPTQLAELWAAASAENGPDSPRAQTLAAEINALNGGSATSEYVFRYPEQTLLYQRAAPILSRYFDAITEPESDPAQVAQLVAQLKALEAATVYSRNYLSNMLAPANSAGSQFDALETKIRAEGQKTAPDAARIEALAKKLAEVTAASQQDRTYQRFWLDSAEGKGRGTALEYGRLRAQRLVVQEKIEVAKKRSNAVKDGSLAARAEAQSQIAELKQLENQLRVRMGDPLIAVKAPQNARQVLAILPDGGLKKLTWNGQSGQWEARFDVPTWTGEGDYSVQIVVVFESGARQKLTMHFSVDLGAPSGIGSLQRDGKTWNLRLETGAQSDRVTAFLPWNERVELRRDEGGIFGAKVEVPDSLENPSRAVRFVVTDGAHNRTEIVVDDSR